MKTKTKECKHPTCSNKCRRISTPKKAKKRLKPYSKKRQKENRTYFALSKQFVADNPYCAIKSPVCTGMTQGPHHVEGRIGDNLTNMEKCIPSCNPCNGYVEVHDAWARENGFKRSRLTNHDN